MVFVASKNNDPLILRGDLCNHRKGKALKTSKTLVAVVAIQSS
jgi:hypothetical protein